MPIIAILARYPNENSHTEELVEITTKNVNFEETKVSMDVDAFGRKFQHGVTVGKGYKVFLSKIMAISGSFYGIKGYEAVGFTCLSKWFIDILKSLPNDTLNELKVVNSPRIPNPFFKTTEQNIEEHLLDQNISSLEEIEVVDYGCISSLTVNPALRRNCSVIFITVTCALNTLSDYQKSIGKFVKKYKEKTKFEFPRSFLDKKVDELNYEKEDNFIFESENSLVIVYGSNFDLEGTKDYSFLKMLYEEKEFESLFNLGKSHVNKTINMVASRLSKFIKRQ
ncbi:hypothetical protein MHBO_001205 [Bonamia ostreae]|uniref:Uncharacterized protein n=1 Tax=Bonamia ostreae TaxID=126728 RepID=A0ABV2AIN7_9EUKA